MPTKSPRLKIGRVFGKRELLFGAARYSGIFALACMAGARKVGNDASGHCTEPSRATKPILEDQSPKVPSTIPRRLTRAISMSVIDPEVSLALNPAATIDPS
jgi:hypothetical protein